MRLLFSSKLLSFALAVLEDDDDDDDGPTYVALGGDFTPVPPEPEAEPDEVDDRFGFQAPRRDHG